MNEFSKELMHMTDAEKRAYNREYYRKNREYWKNYAETGHGIGRQRSNGLGTPGASGRPKTYGGPTTGGYRRGEGLNASKGGLGTPGASGRSKTYGGQTTGGYRRGEGLNANQKKAGRSKEELQKYNRMRYELMGRQQDFGGDNDNARADRINSRKTVGNNASKYWDAESKRLNALQKVVPSSLAGQHGKEAAEAKKLSEHFQKMARGAEGDQAMIAARREDNQKNQANKPLSARLSKTSASSVKSSKSHADGMAFVNNTIDNPKYQLQKINSTLYRRPETITAGQGLRIQGDKFRLENEIMRNEPKKYGSNATPSNVPLSARPKKSYKHGGNGGRW